MSYIPSIYRSTPQQVSVTTIGSNIAISSVDPNYSRITILGQGSVDTSGFVQPSRLRVSFVDATHIIAAGVGNAIVLIEEFNPRFFRQAFHHGTITIGVAATSGSDASGLTLGGKAFPVHNGETSARSSSPGLGLSLTEAMVRTTLSLNRGTGVVSANCASAPYADGQGTIVIGYTLIDPK